MDGTVVLPRFRGITFKGKTVERKIMLAQNAALEHICGVKRMCPAFSADLS